MTLISKIYILNFDHLMIILVRTWKKKWWMSPNEPWGEEGGEKIEKLIGVPGLLFGNWELPYQENKGYQLSYYFVSWTAPKITLDYPSLKIITRKLTNNSQTETN